MINPLGTRMEVNRYHRLATPLTLAMAFLLAGCAGPGIAQQRLVSQPDMVFSSSSIWSFDQTIALQTESGRAFAGGSSAAGCTSCQ